MPGTAERVVEDSDQITNVVLPSLSLWCGPLKEVQKLEVEPEPVTFHDEILRV
jgi:hypothetical protein